MRTSTSPTLLLVALTSILICACTSNSPIQGNHIAKPAIQRAPSVAITPSSHQQLPVLGYVQFRDRTITILSGPAGPVYTITTKDGTAIAKEVSEQELQAKFPDLYQSIKTGVAGNDARL